ncbi:MAG: hypothetical protein R3C30_16755 [Hyphomonadaceae bacterium]
MAPAPAAAGAWVAPEGGQWITSTVLGEREDETYYSEASAYLEVPVRPDTSFVVAPWVESNQYAENLWRAEAVAGVKHAFYRSDDNVLAIQAGALWVSHPDEGCSEGGAEVRFLGGHSASEGRMFFNVEAAGRALSGGCEGGRLDLTAGYRPGDNWLAMGQIFLDTPVEGDDTVKAQLTVVRFGRTGRGIQVGVRARIDGGALEPALVIGLWGRPGG